MPEEMIRRQRELVMPMAQQRMAEFVRGEAPAGCPIAPARFPEVPSIRLNNEVLKLANSTHTLKSFLESSNKIKEPKKK
jgi:hypothetical protein